MSPTLAHLTVWNLMLASMLVAQERTETVDLSCVSALELPTHGLLAARAANSGTVRASIRIGNSGDPSELTLTGLDPILKGEVRVAMRLSHFAPRCQGRTIEFIFAFTLQDPPLDFIVPPAVRFIPPNRFELVFRRVKPNRDPASPPRAPSVK